MIRFQRRFLGCGCRPPVRGCGSRRAVSCGSRRAVSCGSGRAVSCGSRNKVSCGSRSSMSCCKAQSPLPSPAVPPAWPSLRLSWLSADHRDKQTSRRPRAMADGAVPPPWHAACCSAAPHIDPKCIKSSLQPVSGGESASEVGLCSENGGRNTQTGLILEVCSTHGL